MSLAGRTIRKVTGGQYRLLQGNYPPGVEESRKLELLKLTKEGNIESRDELIMSHIRLALSIVNRYIGWHQCRYMRGELDDAAIGGVVYALDRVSKGHLAHDNVTGYIVHFIHNFVSACFQKATLIPKPRGHFRPQAHSIKENSVHYDPRAMSELKDLINCTIETADERRIVDLKIAGYTDSQVGAIMAIPQTRVFRIRQTLKQRFERLNNDD